MDKSGDLPEDAPNWTRGDWNTHPAAASEDPPAYRESNLSLSHTTRRGARTLARAASNAECGGGENSRENECHPRGYLAPGSRETWRGQSRPGAGSTRSWSATCGSSCATWRASGTTWTPTSSSACTSPGPTSGVGRGPGKEGRRFCPRLIPASGTVPAHRNGAAFQASRLPIPVQMRPVYTPRQRSYFLYGRCTLDSTLGIIICNGILLLKEC